MQLDVSMIMQGESGENRQSGIGKELAWKAVVSTLGDIQMASWLLANDESNLRVCLCLRPILMYSYICLLPFCMRNHL